MTILAISSPRSGVPWDSVSSGSRDWLGNHGRATRQRQCCSGTTCQHYCNWCCARGVDCHVWSDFWCSFESRRFSGGCDGGWTPLGRGSSLHLRSDYRRNRWSSDSACHVRVSRSVSVSHRNRSGPAQVFSEFIATFGLLSVIWGCSRLRSTIVPFAVGSYITAAYWFTASTSFANPAVTIARSLSDTFSGIRPLDVPLFLVAQLAGAIGATLLFRWLVPSLRQQAENVVLPYSGKRGANETRA